jgi:MFS family permease
MQDAQTSPILKTNIRLLYIEIALSSVMGAIITFNSAFAIRFGAAPELIALLGAAPALINAVLSIPSGNFLMTRRKHKLWILGSLALFRVFYGILALLPLVVHQHTAEWLVLWMILLNIPLSFFTPGWTSLLGELVVENQRSLVVSRRSIIWATGIAIVSWLAGAWLDRVPFPMNYQWMYAFGLAITVLNQYALNKLIVPDQIPHRVSASEQRPKTVLSPSMRRLLVDTAIYQFGIGLPSQLFVLFYIKNLYASDGWIGINSAAAQIGVVLGYFLWERFYRRRSFSRGLQIASLLTWCFPIALFVFPNLTFIVIMNFVVNAIHPAVDLSTFNILHKMCNNDERQAYVSWYTMVLNTSLFLAPLAGVMISNAFGIAIVFLLSGLIRFVGGILFNLNGVDKPAQRPVHALR